MAKVIGITGKLGSGKGYFASKLISDLKNDGKSVAYTAYADPLKDVLLRNFGLTKTGFKGYSPLDYQGDGYTNTKARLRKGLWHWHKKIVSWDSMSGHDQNNESRSFSVLFEELFDTYGPKLVGLMRKIGDAEVNYDDTFRQIIQMVGTEFGRGINENFWILATFAKIHAALEGGFDAAVIDDVRFPNEKTELELFCEQADYICEVWGVTASDEVRAQRRGLTVAAMQEFDQHGSERYIDEIISTLPAEFVFIND